MSFLWYPFTKITTLTAPYQNPKPSQTHNTTTNTKKSRIRRSSQSRATKGAKTELGLHRPVTETAAVDLRNSRVGGRPWRRKRVGLREEEVAVSAVHGRLLSRPPPHRNEEQLQNLLVIHQIRRRLAHNAPSRTWFQHLPNLLLNPSHEEEKHFSFFPSFVFVSRSLTVTVWFALRACECWGLFYSIV